jgi:phasin family protein
VQRNKSGAGPSRFEFAIVHSMPIVPGGQMYTVPEQVITTSKENVETFLEFAGITATAAEKLIDLNLKMAKTAFSDAVKGAKELSSVKDTQEFVNLQTAWSQPVAEKYAAYLKTTYGLVSETQAELTKLFEQKFADFNKNVVTALDKAVKNAPAGSDVAVAAVKSAMAAANQAYDAISKATKQVSEVTEATIAAATHAPAKKKAA